MTALNILIAPDKFKGSLTATQAARAIAAGWRQVRSNDQLLSLPISDGGEGFAAALGGSLQCRKQWTRTMDAAGRRIRAAWSWQPASAIAVIESASVIGLAMLPPHVFHPFELDTRGLAALLESAASRGVRRCLVGLGGSATNDGGFGLARALGWRFLDAPGQDIERWSGLHKLRTIVPPFGRRLFPRLEIAVDVQNKLLGSRGCTRVFGPQKGLRAADFPLAERCLAQLAKVARAHFGVDFACHPGAGAAGGLAFGLMVFLNAHPVSGFRLFARLTGLPRCLRGADMVITGEGCIDESSLMGKGVGELARDCRAAGIPCVALGGRVIRSAAVENAFTQARGICPDLAAEPGAKRDAARLLSELAALVARHYAPAKSRRPHGRRAKTTRRNDRPPAPRTQPHLAAGHGGAAPVNR